MICLTNKNGDTAEFTIQFEDATVKKAYIQAEAHFTAAERHKYYGGMNLAARNAAKAQLYAKQIVFAKQQDYKPITRTGTLWAYRPEFKTDPVVA